MMNKGAQDVSFGQGCLFHGSILHELGHVLGFYKEHNRIDRDQYLIIYWDNIAPGFEEDFARQRPSEELILTPFDVDSIMMYGTYTFSRDGRSKTMEAKDGSTLLEPLDKRGLSLGDVQAVRKMYCE